MSAPTTTQAAVLEAIEFANTLLDEEHVACVPGNAFGEMSGRYVRMSYATAEVGFPLRSLRSLR